MSSTAASGGVVAVRALDPAARGAVVARLDRGTGVLEPARRSLRNGPVHLSTRAAAVLTSDKRRTELMVARGMGWKYAIVPLIEIHDDAAVGVPADVARALADEMESRGVREMTAVIAPLRAHADHLDAGGPVASSPLGRYMGLGGGGIISSLGGF
ncbi:hypothetical protein [Cellulomonas sp. Y8]|uniref:hypothetical protein n=1 Tax=Cellulomonas sp. Y8 TaxID=2591145 RepID=UPI003D751C56